MLDIPKLREEFDKLKATMTPEKVAEWILNYEERFQLLSSSIYDGCVFSSKINPNHLVYVDSNKEFYDVMIGGTWYTPVIITNKDLQEGDYFVDMHQLRLDHVFTVTGEQSYIDFLNSCRIANNEFVGDTSTKRQFCKVEAIASNGFDIDQIDVRDIMWFLEKLAKK